MTVTFEEQNTLMSLHSILDKSEKQEIQFIHDSEGNQCIAFTRMDGRIFKISVTEILEISPNRFVERKP